MASGGVDLVVWPVAVGALVLLGAALFRWLVTNRVTISNPTVQTNSPTTIAEPAPSEAIQGLADQLSRTMPLKLLGSNAAILPGLSEGALKSTVLDASNPFGIVVQVRAALSAGQLDSVRHLLSASLYQRWSAAPPAPAASTLANLALSATMRSGGNPNRLVVQTSGGVAVPGAAREAWHLTRSPGQPSSWIVDDVEAASSITS